MPQAFQQLAQSNPELLHLLNENAEQVFNMMEERMDDGGAGHAGENTIPWDTSSTHTANASYGEIRPHEREAIERVSRIFKVHMDKKAI